MKDVEILTSSDPGVSSDWDCLLGVLVLELTDSLLLSSKVTHPLPLTLVAGCVSVSAMSITQVYLTL